MLLNIYTPILTYRLATITLTECMCQYLNPSANMARQEFLAEYGKKIPRKSSGKSKSNLACRTNGSKKLRLEYLLAIKANSKTDFSSKIEEFTQPHDRWYLWDNDDNKTKLYNSIVQTQKPKLRLKYSVESVYAVFLSQGWVDNDHAHHSSVDTSTTLTQQPPLSAVVCTKDTLIGTNESSNLISSQPFVSPLASSSTFSSTLHIPRTIKERFPLEVHSSLVAACDDRHLRDCLPNLLVENDKVKKLELNANETNVKHENTELHDNMTALVRDMHTTFGSRTSVTTKQCLRTRTIELLDKMTAEQKRLTTNLKQARHPNPNLNPNTNPNPNPNPNPYKQARYRANKLVPTTNTDSNTKYVPRAGEGLTHSSYNYGPSDKRTGEPPYNLAYII